MLATKRIATFFKDSRVKVRLSQSEVATFMGYSCAQFVSNWERGISTPPLEKLPKLLDLYRLDRNDLIELVLQETRSFLEGALKPKQM
jgi:transcriptional regulator with XRE-family HTH domain